MKRLVIDFVFGMICFALGCYFGLQIGAPSETEKQMPVAIQDRWNQDADTVNDHIPEADIGAEIVAMNERALEKAGVPQR